MEQQPDPPISVVIPDYINLAAAFGRLGEQIKEFLAVARRLGFPEADGSLTFATPSPTFTDAWTRVELVSVGPQLCLPQEPEAMVEIPDPRGGTTWHYRDPEHRATMDLIQSVRSPRPYRLSPTRDYFVLPAAVIVRLESLAQEWIAAAPEIPTEADLIPLAEAIERFDISRSTIDRNPHIVRKIKDPEGNAQSPVFVFRQDMEALQAHLGGKSPDL